MLASAYLASEYKTSLSLLVLSLANVYLYAKFSYHITLYGLSKNVYERRMKLLGMNILLILILAVIENRGSKAVNNNLIYNY